MEYRKIDAINQSRLKKILKSPKEYFDNKNKTTDYFTFGSVVDFLLTEKKKDFNEEYFVPIIKTPPDNIKFIIDKIYENEKFRKSIDEEFTVLDSVQIEELILKIATEINYGQSYKKETLLTKVYDGGLGYLESLRNAEGKQIISPDDFNKAKTRVMEVLSNPQLAKYFKKESKDYDILFKPVIQFEYHGFTCKGELDIVIVHHGVKKIIPLDVKTTSDTIYGFNYNFWKYRYDFQAAFYTLGITGDKYFQPLIENGGYTVTSFKFLVIEANGYNPPVMFNSNPLLHNIGLNGGVLANGKEIEGVNQAFNRLQWHIENNKWDFSKDYYDNNCEFPLTI